MALQPWYWLVSAWLASCRAVHGSQLVTMSSYDSSSDVTTLRSSSNESPSNSL